MICDLAGMAELADLPAGRQARRNIKYDMWYVYILRSKKNGYLYKGLTDNIDRRLKEHERGKSTYIKNLLPIELVYVEVCENRQQARITEKYYKSGSGRELIKELLETLY